MKQLKSVDDLWCSSQLSLEQRREIIILSLLEFEKPFNERQEPFQLVELVKGHHF